MKQDRAGAPVDVVELDRNDFHRAQAKPRDKEQHGIVAPSKVLRSKAMINLRRELEREGYAFGPGAIIREALDIYEDDFHALVEAGRVLPIDPYDPSGMRLRALSQAILAPWANALSWLPPCIDGRTSALYTTYFQDLSSNPEIGGV